MTIERSSGAGAPGTTADTVAANKVVVTPVGNLAADDAQEAFQELDADLTAHMDDTAGAHAASAIANTPAGEVVATTVQAAINELDVDLTAHFADATDAHDASAISNVPAGAIVATDVQGAIDELDADLTAHINDTVDAHDASAISNVPAGAIAATTVQAAIDELDAEKQPLDGELTALAGLTSAADKLPYFTGAGAAALADLTSVARTLIAQTTQALMRSVGLGLSDISVRVTKSANQSINDATSTLVTFDTEVFDTDTMHNNVTNNSRLTVTTAGKYLVWFTIGFAANATGLRLIDLSKNGVLAAPPLFLSGTELAGASSYFSGSVLINLVATDYVEIFARQDSGGALNVNSDSVFWAVKMN